MQRDLKVGLSLGVLVLGVVGALLFRREPVSETHQPTLKLARKIDERIAERARTPYMTGDVEFDEDDTANTSKSDSDLIDDSRPAHTVAPNWLKDDEDPFQIAKSDHGKFDFHNKTDADSTAIAQLQPRSSTAGRNSRSAADPVVQTHVIQSGDSLSLLAERYLGSQGRFQELYEANRDVLTDVNRLPLGATIVIPSEPKTASKSQTGTTARTAMNHLEKVHSTITDVSTFEPLAPPSDNATQAGKSDSSVSKEQPAAVAPTPKVQETKKFVTPTRLPFSNRNSSLVAPNPQRKALDPEGEQFTPSKPAAGATTVSTTGQSRHYQVRKGDSLDKISTKIYGNARRASDIFAANRSLLSGPNALREGQELVLPE